MLLRRRLSLCLKGFDFSSIVDMTSDSNAICSLSKSGGSSAYLATSSWVRTSPPPTNYRAFFAASSRNGGNASAWWQIKFNQEVPLNMIQFRCPAWMEYNYSPFVLNIYTLDKNSATAFVKQQSMTISKVSYEVHTYITELQKININTRCWGVRLQTTKSWFGDSYPSTTYMTLDNFCCY